MAALVVLLFSASAWAAPAAFPVEETTITELHAALLARKTTAHEVVAAYLARIAAYDKAGPHLNSVVNLNPRALDEAAALDAKLAATGRLVGPLHGVPVLVKDCIDVAGLPCTSGFQGWKNYVPPGDAPHIAQIKAAGGVILAKVSLSEFTNGGGDNINSVLGGFCRNPYNPAYATGGSSGGTGAGIAANFGLVGIGTDTGGSVRMPSAHCALVGLRPTVGLVSRTGMIPNSSLRDTPGPMTRTVTDLAMLLDAMVGPDPVDPATQRAEGHIAKTYTAALKRDALKGARLGVLRQVFTPKNTDPRIIANFEQTLAELRAAGAEIVGDFFVPEIEKLPRAPQTPARKKADLLKFFAAHPGIPYASPQAMADSRLAHPLHQAGLEATAAAGPAETDPATLKGIETENAYRAAFTEAMDAAKIDAVIFPTWAQLPVVNGDRNTQLMTDEPKPVPAGASVAGSTSPTVVTGLGSSLTFVGSTLQWPALSVPNGYLGEGLPVGLQILGRAWDEAKLIGYAYAYEQATHYRRPPASTPPLAESFAQKFVGTWKLVAIRDRDAATGVETPAARAAAAGQLIYAVNGRLSVQIVRAGRDKNSATASADGFSSYFGRWELAPAEGCVIHHQDGNLNAKQAGTATKRFYSFDAAGRLALATPPVPRADGRTLSSVFVWEKIF